MVKNIVRIPKNHSKLKLINSLTHVSTIDSYVCFQEQDRTPGVCLTCPPPLGEHFHLQILLTCVPNLALMRLQGLSWLMGAYLNKLYRCYRLWVMPLRRYLRRAHPWCHLLRGTVFLQEFALPRSNHNIDNFLLEKEKKRCNIPLGGKCQ